MGWSVSQEICRDFARSAQLEWLLTNGIGGYAMGTVSGANTRRYHGHLIAATNPPTGRVQLLAALEAYAVIRGRAYGISTNQYSGAIHPQGYMLLNSFAVGDHAEWEFELPGTALKKQLAIHQGENASTIRYINTGEEQLELSLRPLVCHKPHHENFEASDYYPEFLLQPADRTVLSHRGQTLTLCHPQAHATPSSGWYYRFEHVREAERGLNSRDDLFCPVELTYTLPPGEAAVMTVALNMDSVEPWTFGEITTLESPQDQLHRAAKYFIVRTEDRSTIMAGYPWFVDWGRDAMIALPGLCLYGGDVEAAQEIIRSYAKHMNKGIIPNFFDEETGEPRYNSADATLWFANAIYQYLQKNWTREFAIECLAWLRESIEWHHKGTWHGIKVDPTDGLLTQGTHDTQLTWMDVKIGDWAATPRHGKPVEVNGLWVNALRIAEWLCEQLEQDGLDYKLKADQAAASFNKKFWRGTAHHYLDTVDPDDGSLRPNQVIALSLPFSPAKRDQAIAALDVVEDQLLTPKGLRSLGPKEPGYVGRYEGTLQARDAAYHQGTVWPWLIGPYVEAILKWKNDREGAQKIVDAATSLLYEGGLGGVAEVYDGDGNQRPDGCLWQAWSTAELIKSWGILTNGSQ